VDQEALLRQIGERLAQLRIARGLDPGAAAAAARIDDERLAAAEDGAITLTGDELDRLVHAYGIEPTEVFGGRTTPVQNVLGG
jgi:transcriptional regulator with XRE-family HTH domain